MSRVDRLHALLERVQRNAQGVRVRAAASRSFGSGAAVPESEPGESVALDELTVVEGDVFEVEPVSDAIAFEDEMPTSVHDDFDVVVEEELPASSPRPRVASSMDEALAEAAQQAEAPLTPPPESGAGPASVRELQIPSAAAVPTTEQLGQTVSLEEGPRADFELDEPLEEPTESVPAPSSRHLEAELPGTRVGTYDQSLQVPEGAREELERHRLGEVAAQVVARPVISTNVTDFVNAHRRFEAVSFVELLDASLALGSD